MEIEDIFKLLKFWRFFKNLKNFRSGGLRIKFKAVAMVFALGFSGVSYFFLDGVNVEAFELTAQDQPVLEACLGNHKRSNMSFQDSIPDKAGCACTAKMVTASIEQDHLNTWAQAHALMLHGYELEWSVKTKAQEKQFQINKAQMFSALQKKSNMPSTRYSEMVESLYEIDTVCDSEISYDVSNITQIAALRPIGFVEEAMLIAGEPSETGVVELQLRGAHGPIKTASK